MYLVDTNIISAASPFRQAPAELIAWMDARSASLFLSAVTVAEIEDGIAKLRRGGATRKSRDLSAWLESVIHLYGDRILVFDTPTARIAGVLSDRARGQGHAPGFQRHHYRGNSAAQLLDDLVTQHPAFCAVRRTSFQSLSCNTAFVSSIQNDQCLWTRSRRRFTTRSGSRPNPWRDRRRARARSSHRS